MNIITISREFGSGGRQIAKAVAESLGYDYYDREIITEIAKRNNVEENYVEYAINNHAWQTFSLSFHHSFMSPIAIQTPDTSLLRAQRHIIEEIAASGKNCVIVGRNADILLKEYNPLNVFICANMEDKIQRCKSYSEVNHESMNDKEIKKMITRIDKNRARTRSIIAEGEWGHRHYYNLIVNTSSWDLSVLSESIANFAKNYFEKGKKI